MGTVTSKTKALDVICTTNFLSVTLEDVRVLSVPLWWYPRLPEASLQNQSQVEIFGDGQ